MSNAQGVLDRFPRTRGDRPVTGDFVEKNRGSTPAEWKRLSEVYNNETTFKNSITLLDNIDIIIVRSNSERLDLLKLFGRYGIEELPDGRQVDDIIMVQ